MARFILFLGFFLMISHSSIAQVPSHETTDVSLEAKYGARNLIKVSRPSDASPSFDIISCTATMLVDSVEIPLSEVKKSGKTNGHFIWSKKDCSLELTTTFDYGKWYIRTKYIAQDGVTIKTKKDFVKLQPIYPHDVTDGITPSVNMSASVSFNKPAFHDLKKVEIMTMKSNDNVDLKYQIHPNLHSSMFENVECTDNKCKFVFREWKDEYYGQWLIRSVFKESRTQKIIQKFTIINANRPKSTGLRNEDDEEMMKIWSERTRSDVAHVSVGGRVRVNIKRPNKGKIEQCSVVHMEPATLISFDKNSGDYDHFIEFTNDADCSFIMKNFKSEMYGKWNITTVYKYVDDGFRNIHKEQVNFIYIDASDESIEDRPVTPDFEFTVLPVSEPEKKIQVNVGERLLLSPDNNTTGYVDRCEAVHVGEYEDTTYEIQPSRDRRLSFDYTGFYTNCNFTFTSFERKFYGKWIVSSYYTQPKNSGNRFRKDVVFQIVEKK